MTDPLSSNNGVLQLELEADDTNRNLTIYLTSTAVINKSKTDDLEANAVYKMIVRFDGTASFDFQLAQTRRVGDRQTLTKVKDGKFDAANTYVTFLLDVRTNLGPRHRCPPQASN